MQFHKWFDILLESGASDLHIEAGQVPKYRLHGHLQPIAGEPSLTNEQLEIWMSEIAPSGLMETFIPKGDADFAYAYGDKARFRANYFRHFDGLGCIFRIIPSRILTLEELGCPSVFKKFAELRSGLVLVTGPTGSGKSTTLAAILDYMNSSLDKKVITIEDPVEFVHPPKRSVFVHREVHQDTESFSSGLQAAIKSDVDVVLVGEMRDQETIELALNATEMGILVFGTLHTNSAPKTIDRIIDTFPAKRKPQIRNILANSLQGIVSQQLLRSADGNRRYAAHEILVATPGLLSLVREGGKVSQFTDAIQAGARLGMQTMDGCLMQMVKEGKVTAQEAHLKALNKDLFRESLSH